MKKDQSFIRQKRAQIGSTNMPSHSFMQNSIKVMKTSYAGQILHTTKNRAKIVRLEFWLRATSNKHRPEIMLKQFNFKKRRPIHSPIQFTITQNIQNARKGRNSQNESTIPMSHKIEIQINSKQNKSKPKNNRHESEDFFALPPPAPIAVVWRDHIFYP